MQSAKKYDFKIQAEGGGQRIDRFLSTKLPEHSRAFYQKLIQKAFVTVNELSVKPSYKLELNDYVHVQIPPPEETQILAENIPLDVVYEDSNLLVVNKPAGMVVHPGAGVQQGTLVNALMYHCKDLSGVGGRLRPGIVHRLDKNTSGLLVVAKNDSAHIALQKQFAEKTANRIYQAIVWGNTLMNEDRIETFLNRSKSDRKKFSVASNGKSAITYYKVKQLFSFLTWVEITLQTGRTHQIRVHFNHLHHPVFGDPDYSGRKMQINRLSTLSEKNFALYLLKQIHRQALHAYRLSFHHPATAERMHFEVSLPKDMKNLLDKLNSREEL